MALAVTAQREYDGLLPGDKILILKIASGGSVKVEFQLGTDWILSDTFTESGVKIVMTGRSKFRITPTAGSSFGLE